MRSLIILWLTMSVLVLAVFGMGQGAGQVAAPGGDTGATSAEKSSIPTEQQFTTGRSYVVEGTVVRTYANSLVLRNAHGFMVEVALTAYTEIRERKSNPFRRAKIYAVAQLLRGLDVEVTGHGGSSGALVADEILFTQDDLRLANTIEARVDPVEARLTQNEDNALRLSGQVSELASVSNAARGGARAAQETADTALASARQADTEARNAGAGVRAANERIAALDDFDAKDSVTVSFRAGSAMLSPQAKEELDRIAGAALKEKGYLIEVAGFASSEGGEGSNRVLSQHRADAVIRYLAENHSIPLRRFTAPFGYGEKMPVADNKTRAGREQNRRVEVRVLVSKGLGQTGSSTVAMGS